MICRVHCDFSCQVLPYWISHTSNCKQVIGYFDPRARYYNDRERVNLCILAELVKQPPLLAGTCESRNAGTRNGTMYQELSGKDHHIDLFYCPVQAAFLLYLQIPTPCLVHLQTPTVCLLHLLISTACLLHLQTPTGSSCTSRRLQFPPAPPDTYSFLLHLQTPIVCLLHLLLPPAPPSTACLLHLQILLASCASRYPWS